MPEVLLPVSRTIAALGLTLFCTAIPLSPAAGADAPMKEDAAMTGGASGPKGPLQEGAGGSTARPATMPATTQAATAPAEPPPPPLGERLNVVVTVKSAAVSRVTLRRVTPYPGGRKGPKETQSQDQMLVVRLEIKNDCNIASLVFEAPPATTPETSPSLEDATGLGFPSVRFPDFEPVDSLHTVTLKPGEVAPDVLIFAPPARDVTPLHLRIPMKVSRRDLVLEADIDPKDIKRQ